jgi:hypothetical protein
MFVAGGSTPPTPEVVIARRSPGNELDLWLQPRFRVTREIAIGAAIRTERMGEGSDAIGGLPMSLPARSRTSVGGDFRYTTLPGFAEGRSRFAMETTVGFRGTVRGSAGLPVSHLAYVQISVQRRLWSRGGPLEQPFSPRRQGGPIEEDAPPPR